MSNTSEREQDLAISPADIFAARERLRGVASLTPLIEYPALAEIFGGPVLIKFEGAQREGSFKFRGAYNCLAQLTAAEIETGVVAWSSGNHAQGVASAARRLNTPAVIVMPSNAPKVKIANARNLGAEIVLYDRATESREEIATRIAKDRGAVLVPSFDDPDVIAGQGTIGLEIIEQASAQGREVDQILVPCCGGGLISGIAMAVCSSNPAIKVHSVEPEGFDDTARSLVAGRRVRNAAGKESICDALMVPEPGVLTFPISLRYLADGLVVSDDQVRAAVAYAYRFLRLVAEPGGAVGLAALLSGMIPTTGRTTVVVISGSNIDPELFTSIIADGTK